MARVAHRLFFVVLAALSAVACALACALWGVSYSRRDCLSLERSRAYSVYSDAGRFGISYSEQRVIAPFADPTPTNRLAPYSSTWRLSHLFFPSSGSITSRDFCGFSECHFDLTAMRIPGETISYASIALSHWVVVLSLLLLTGISLGMVRPHKFRVGFVVSPCTK